MPHSVAQSTIFIEDLQVDTCIGIDEWEQHVEQTLHFDLHMEVDIDAAMQSDAVADTLDYSAVAALLEQTVAASKARLLEGLLGELFEQLFASSDRIASLTITVRKPQAIDAAACAGITLRRERGR